MSGTKRDWRTDDFDFDLPVDRIAQEAASPRDAAKLLHVTSETLFDRRVFDLPDLLRAGDVLVVNDTKVIPARLFGKRGEMKSEIFLHKKNDDGTWLAFARPAKRLREGESVVFAPGFAAKILRKEEDGQVAVSFDLPDADFYRLLEKHGEPPLPPYIKRAAGEARNDAGRYQTVYAAKEGAVAAPTAGLHFTHELFAKLNAKGIKRVTVTLHVGAGTFLPVKADRLADHKMHAEWGEVSAETAATINAARSAGGRIVCVGTTSLRLIESAADADGKVEAFTGDTSIFIYPGYRFKAADILLTNFHLPKSTLFMLISAFAGLSRMKNAYQYAIDNGYRFYSYGDATLLERNPPEE